MVGVRSGDKGRGRDGEPLSQLRARHRRQGPGDRAGRGSWGHLTGAAIREFDLAEDREPQVWELGVKEIWKVPKPLDRIIHTIGPWPLKLSSRYGQIGGTWLYPMKDEKTGDDLVSIGFVIDLEYFGTPPPRPTTCSSCSRPTRWCARRSKAAGAWAGGQALPGGGYWSMPKLSMPGAVLVGDSGGMVDTVALKGVHHCIISRRLAAEAIYASLKQGVVLRGLRGRRGGVEIGQELYEVRNTRQPFQRGFLQGGPIVNLLIATKGRFPGGRSWHRSDLQPMFIGKTRTAIPSPTASTSSTSCRRSTSRATRRATTPQPHPGPEERPARDRRDVGVDVPRRRVEIPEDAPQQGDVDVTVNYTNCVQCGAITAKGGRLTTPEGCTSRRARRV